MALSKLDNLYRQVILDHSSHPHHHGQLQDGETVDLNNPTCGDVIKLSLKLDGDTITDIAFDGSGCSISTASASMMTDAVIGKTADEAFELADIFSEMVQGKADDRQERLGDGALLSGVAKFPQRIKCSTLAWNALKKALENNNGSSDVANLSGHCEI
ncbi:SUF system NifU family Fe-S cluster assembly protein [Lactococcus raffinolactis]|uniref:SUF system NifU family Fe-S cluster assembly protein n=1 Tax=Pseudolactococcus raffinolactis TaxID=1366 RepID=A0A6H0UHV2_9LACT|nr:SUF system NifU family Fe-S cluster assembly protein [Lactococcus raffinolactis]QIW54427.1 SUF system NifU family Fe-S cluster assembly protein [Lactococcus raffinolactis]